MGNCYSADYFAEDHIYTDITCNNHNRSTALKQSVIDYFGGVGIKHVLLDPNVRP